jgi:toxin ParE1/3/4
MARIIWSEPALEHLQEIHEWISQDSRRNADAMIRRLTAATDRLIDFPESGRRLPERPTDSHREVIVGSYRVIYRYTSDRDEVEIVAVVHARRLLPPVLCCHSGHIGCDGGRSMPAGSCRPFSEHLDSGLGVMRRGLIATRWATRPGDCAHHSTCQPGMNGAG